MAKISKELEYAVQNGLLNSFRYGSKAFLSVFREAREALALGQIQLSVEDLDLLLETDIGSVCEFEGEEVALDLPMLEAEAAEFKGRDVDLNKPMKGDVKKFKVFVKDPKTGNVKKINFGLNTNRKLLEDPQRRAAFTARHNCESANDKLTPKYWSCRTNRFFHKIFGGKPIGGRFW